MKERFVLCILFLLALVSPIVAETGDSSNQLTCQECRIENQKLNDNISRLQDNITELEDNITELKQERDYYERQMNYYRQQYLAKDSNLTNRRVKNLNDNITLIKNVINNNQNRILSLNQEFDSLLKLVQNKIVIGIVIGSLFGGFFGGVISQEVNLIQIVRRRLKDEAGEKEET